LHSLSLYQRVDKDRAAIGERKGIVVLVQHLWRYFTKLRNVKIHGASNEPSPAIPDVFFKRQLSARQKANRNTLF
jgi:hypothetical protein